MLMVHYCAVYRLAWSHVDLRKCALQLSWGATKRAVKLHPIMLVNPSMPVMTSIITFKQE